MLITSQLSGFYQGAEFVLPYYSAFTVNLGDASSSNSPTSFTYVNKVLPAAITRTGSFVKIRVKGPTSGSGVMTACYIGLSATSGNAWNFATTPVQILWDNGNASKTLDPNQTYTSDAATFSITGGQAISIALQYSTGFRVSSTGAATSNFMQYSKASVTEAGTVSKGGNYKGKSKGFVTVTELLVA